MGRSVKIVDLETETSNHVIGIEACFFDSRNKEYVLTLHDVEIGEHSRSVMFDFAVPSVLSIEKDVKRFSDKRLREHAINWKNVKGVKPLIEQICKVRKLKLTAEARKIAELPELPE